MYFAVQNQSTPNIFVDVENLFVTILKKYGKEKPLKF
jgi:hypothetical protein